jgi:branched-chain amino acid aminotransferase
MSASGADLGGWTVGVSAFLDGGYVPLNDVTVGITSHAFNYGTNVFEGLRAYWDADAAELNLFRADRHYVRLHHSARFYDMELPYSVEELCQITRRLLSRDAVRQDVYIRPLLFKSSEGIGLWREGLEDSFAIFYVPMGKYITDGGIRCCVSPWRRPDGNVAPARAKIGGMYAPMALARHEAMAHGFDEALMLTADGKVAEGTGENIFLAQDGVLVTPAPGEDLLAGITRACLIELATEELGIAVVERSVNRSELYTSDEIFLCGTAAEVTPVLEIDHRAIGDGGIGPLSAAVRDLYAGVVRGRNDAYVKWCLPVYAEGPRT